MKGSLAGSLATGTPLCRHACSQARRWLAQPELGISGTSGINGLIDPVASPEGFLTLYITSWPCIEVLVPYLASEGLHARWGRR